MAALSSLDFDFENIVFSFRQNNNYKHHGKIRGQQKNMKIMQNYLFFKKTGFCLFFLKIPIMLLIVLNGCCYCA